ncbi:MAG: CAP domain-containing protein, partial [Oscillochloridaceae bacterium umkhey_bin13]
MLTRWFLLASVVLLAVFAPAQPAAAQTAQRCFAETGFCIEGPIRQYWERNGGLTVFGFPKSNLALEAVEGVDLTVQWFERDRLEIQPDGRVTAGRLGVRWLELQGTPWQRGNDPAGGDGCLAFSETGHRVCGAFATYWQRNGGLERFGFPITGAFATTIEGKPVTVQYFERRRFELHEANQVLLGLLGNEVRSAQGGSQAPTGVHPFVRAVIDLTNQARQANGCTVPLTMNRLLNQAALGHSQDMAQRGYFSHFSPEGRDPSDRVDATGYQWQMVGENIA